MKRYFYASPENKVKQNSMRVRVSVLGCSERSVWAVGQRPGQCSRSAPSTVNVHSPDPQGPEDTGVKRKSKGTLATARAPSTPRELCHFPSFYATLAEVPGSLWSHNKLAISLRADSLSKTLDIPSTWYCLFSVSPWSLKFTLPS